MANKILKQIKYDAGTGGRNYQCPVCGAAIEGEQCEYCGAVIYDFANINLDGTSFVRFKYNDMYITMKVAAINPCFTFEQNSVDAYSSNSTIIKRFYRPPTLKVNLELEAINDNGNLFTVIKVGE